MEPLSDPKKDRVVNNLKAPPHKHLDRNLLWPEKIKFKPDWRLLKSHLQREGRVAKEDLIQIVNEMNRIFRNEGNLVYLEDPVTVVGDIHGQFYDLIKILEVGGNPESTKYLFLGDFVDRGLFSIEVILLLYSLKINYPTTIFFLRGNHECRQMSSFFNFREECLKKYDQDVYNLLMDSFDLLPLVCIVNGRFLGVHGGISPDLRSLDSINRIDRFKEPPHTGIFCDLLWSDPVENENGYSDTIFKNNEVRGCSFFFGVNAVNKFLEANNLISIIRAHEAQLEGYKMHRWNGPNEFPAVITVFSAPNYCDVYNNKGAVIKFDNNTLNIQQYNYSEHPYLLPQFMDIFTWSLPFVAEKLSELFYNMLKPGMHEEDDDEKINTETNNIKKNEKNSNDMKKIEKYEPNAHGYSEKGNKLRNKIKFVAKMATLQKTLRQNNEDIIKIKLMSSDGKIPKGLLQKGGSAIKEAVQAFEAAKLADKINERRPENLNDNNMPSYKNKTNYKMF